MGREGAAILFSEYHHSRNLKKNNYGVFKGSVNSYQGDSRGWAREKQRRREGEAHEQGEIEQGRSKKDTEAGSIYFE